MGNKGVQANKRGKNRVYFIELLTTKKCNKNCYYCTTHDINDVEVDIDYLKWVLDQLPSSTGVELTGGEVGLVPNIDEVYKTVRAHPSIKHIMVMSNGLLRANGVDWIKEVEYWEHLIYEIKGREVIKFYNHLDLDQDHRYVIVTTDSTTHSLIANMDYYEDLGFFRPNFFYKLMNHKSKMSIDSYYNDLIKLYLKVGNKYFQNMLAHYKMKSYLAEEKIMCEKISPNPFIDLQTKQLGHCAINVVKSDKWEFSKENLEKLRNGEFYRGCDYCKKCYSFDHGVGRSKDYNRSYHD
jgi:MoaA/NifB/PqqE/SkfB family radical SAM enzyme